jgi:hypothetical protein
MYTYQKALVAYFCLYFPEVNDSVVENIHCEVTRNFPAMDLIFPGQRFFKLQRSGNREIHMAYKPRWSEKEDKFVIDCLGPFSGIRSRRGPANSVAPKSGMIRIRLAGDGAGCERLAASDQILLTRDNVGPSTLREIKKIFCWNQEPGESYSGFTSRVCAAIQSLRPVSNLLLGFAAPAISKRLEPWEMSTKIFNESKEPALVRVLRDFDLYATKQAIVGPSKKPPPVAIVESPSINDETLLAFPSPRRLAFDVDEDLLDPGIFPDMDDGDALPDNCHIPPLDLGLPNRDVRQILPNSPADEGMRAATVRNKPIKVKQYPSLTIDGNSETIDWGASNMERCARVEWFPGFRRITCPDQHSLSRVVGDTFRTLTGSRDLLDLLDSENLILQSIGGMHDEAKNAVNSCLTGCGRQTEKHAHAFSKNDYVLTEWKVEGKVWYSAENTHLTSANFNLAERCLLVDRIADCLGGRRHIDATTNNMVWVFDSIPTAVDFQNYCVFLLCGNSNHFFGLHNRARKIYLRRCRQEAARAARKELSNSSRKRKANQVVEPEPEPHFVVGFRRHDTRLPYFFVIGNSDQKRCTNPLVQHDFCIAIPDRIFYQTHYTAIESKPKTRPPNKANKGNAIFVRFLQTAQIVPSVIPV